MSGSILTWLLTSVLGQRPSVQQVSLIRKLIYLGLMLLLLTASYFYRIYAAEPLARELAIRDSDVGEVELTGSAMRLAMPGFRGVLTCGVWMAAIDAQKKGQWEELDVYVAATTKLQPHFNTPWQFQSWNMAFNVVNRCDLPADKYFYLARGLDLLAEGERKNRYDPELRFHVGLYYQMRIGRWEYAPIMHSLMELSCIDPIQRDPARFEYITPEQTDPDFKDYVYMDKRTLPFTQAYQYLETLNERLTKLPNPDSQSEQQKKIAAVLKREIDEVSKPIANFDRFCETYPRLIRRLHSPSNARIQRPRDKPEDIILFLKDHKNIPSLYGTAREKIGDEERTMLKKNKEHPFPVWPQDPEQYSSEKEPIAKYLDTSPRGEGDRCDVFMTGRSWFLFAQEPLPKPIRDYPGKSEPINPEEILRKRIPKKMTTIIFRNYPARARSFVAERLAEEGWFDEKGWALEWNPIKGRVQMLGERAKPEEGWGVVSWKQAFEDWKTYGDTTGLQLSPNEEDRMTELAEKYRKRHNLDPGTKYAGEPDPNPEYQEQGRAYEQLELYNYARRLVNLAHHYHRAEMEFELDTIDARKELYQVQRARLTDDEKPDEMERVLEKWRQVLMIRQQYAADSDQQKDTDELGKKYREAYVESSEGKTMKKLHLVQAALGQTLTPDPALQATQTFRAFKWKNVAPPEQIVYAPRAIANARYLGVMGQSAAPPQTWSWTGVVRLYVGPGAVVSPLGPLDDFGAPVYFKKLPR